MKLEVTTPVEDSKSKMDSTESELIAPDQAKSVLNGNGIKNGNGTDASDKKISQNGNSHEGDSPPASPLVQKEKQTSKSPSSSVDEDKHSTNDVPPGETKMDGESNHKVLDSKSDNEVSKSEKDETSPGAVDGVNDGAKDDSEGDEKGNDKPVVQEGRSPRRSTRISSKPEPINEEVEKVKEPIQNKEETGTAVKPHVDEQDLEKVKSGGLVLKLDSGEEFSVQLADDDEEEEAKSHCDQKTPVSDDDDVCVVRVESKPAPQQAVGVKINFPPGLKPMPALKPKPASVKNPAFTPVVQPGGNILVPVQYTSTPKSVLNSAHINLPAGLLNSTSQIRTSLAQQVKTAPVPVIDPVSAANYVKVKQEHEKKVAEFKGLSNFLANMRSSVTIKSGVDALREHLLKLSHYKARVNKAAANKNEKVINDADLKKDTEISDQKGDTVKDGTVKDGTVKGDGKAESDSETGEKMDVTTDVEMKDEDQSEKCENVDSEKETDKKEVSVNVCKSDKPVDSEDHDASKTDEGKVSASSEDAPKVNGDTAQPSEKSPAPEEKPKDAAVDDDKDKQIHEEAAKKLRPVARFLYYSGLDLAREYVYKDLLDKNEVLLDKKKLTFEEEADYHRLKRIYVSFRRKNRPVHPKLQKCRSCNYYSESINVMRLHQEFGHVDFTLGRFSCVMCGFETRALNAYKFHMEAEHNMLGRTSIKPCFWHCDLCPFEHNNKAMVIKHKLKCGKKFDIKKHLFPTYDDINFLFRALPGPSIGPNPANHPPLPPVAKQTWSTVGAKTAMTPNVVRNVLPTTYATGPVSFISRAPAPPIVTVANQRTFTIQQPSPRAPVVSSKPTLIRHLINKNAVVANMPTHTTVVPSQLVGKRPAAVSSQLSTPPAKVARSDLEICEICGGFIKDRQSLRLHFKMAHCIDIDETVITTKASAPLSCDVCSKRFWTFQGLTMHRVAMNHIPQTGAGKSTRGSKCFICSVFVADIMKHINSTHNMIPGQLNTIRICPVCGNTMQPGNLVSHLKLLHNMVLPVPGLSTYGGNVNPNPDENRKVYTCPTCKRSFITLQALNSHIDQLHSYKCHMCQFRCTSMEQYKTHITSAHQKKPVAISTTPTNRQCSVCKKVFAGAGYTQHIQQEHCRKFAIKLERCDHLVDLFKAPSKMSD